MANQGNSKSADTIIDKDQLNYLNSMHDAPAVRLDAEFYQADDIDGDADGLSGSGNLNYLVLQSQQTHDASALNNPFQIMDGNHLFNGHMMGAGPSAGNMDSPGYGNFSDDDNNESLAGNGGDFNLGEGSNTGQDISNLGTGLGIAGASALKARSFNEGDNYSEDTKISIVNYPPHKPEPPKEPPEDPPNPPDPPKNDDYDLVVDVNTPILDIDLDVILDPIENIVGDIDIDIDAIIDNILPGDHGLLPDISASVDAVLDGTTLLGLDLEEVLDPLDPLVSGVTNLLDDVIGSVEDLLPNTLIQPVTDILNTVVDLTGLNGGNGDTDLLLNLGAVIPGFTVLDTSLDVPLNPLELLLGDIDITIDAQTLVEDLGEHTFAIIDDLHALDVEGVIGTVISDDGILQNIDGIIPQLDLGLDIATDIFPDFDAALASNDILGYVTDLISDITADLDDTLPAGDILGSDVVTGLLDNLLAGDPVPVPGSDTDLTIDTGLDVVGLDIPDINLDIPLDPLESILGDIDIGLDLVSLTDPESVTDILHDALAGDIDGIIDDLNTGVGLDTHLDLLEGNDIDLDIFPDNLGDIASDVGAVTEGLSDAVGSLLGSPQIPDVLPDPVGTITEGLGHVVDTTPVLGGLGGLLHHGGGGLFG